MVGEQQLPGFIKFYDQITVTVFQRIADQIAKDPGDGVPVQNTADFSAQDERTVRYLKGETTEDGAGEDGWCLVCTDGFPLGFAKRSRGILKNKYYPGWRWQ